MSPKALCFLLFAWSCSSLAAAETPMLPTTDGTSWRYAVNDEPGEPSTLLVQIAGTEEFEGRPALKFETVSDGKVSKAELIRVDEKGVNCIARTGRDGGMLKLEPAELITPAELKTGATFDVEGDVAGVRLAQHYQVVAEENVLVPAGSLHAFHVHCDAAALMKVAIDRWFAPGIGLVKQVTTVRGPSGGLLQKTTTELQKRPEVAPRAAAPPTPSPAPPPPASSPTATPGPMPDLADDSAATPPAASPSPTGTATRLTVEVSSEPDTGMKTAFRADVQKIYVRWRGHGLPEGATVRVAWVAEDVGGLVDPNFVVDQTETVVPSPDSSARFTLGRPEDGWAEGKYRVEFYIDDKLEEKIAVTIK